MTFLAKIKAKALVCLQIRTAMVSMDCTHQLSRREGIRKFDFVEKIRKSIYIAFFKKSLGWFKDVVIGSWKGHYAVVT